jgi:hypothetical protein
MVLGSSSELNLAHFGKVSEALDYVFVATVH